jgi:catechol 2,3-dioxygenase-like lactoylglutathione lyase family enzyme
VTLVCKYVALHVPDLRAAERFYCEVFGLEVRFRESKAADGGWYTLRSPLGWDEAARRGISVDMLALDRDGFTLALVPGTPPAGALYEVCIGAAPVEIAELRARAERSATVLDSEREWFRFRDPFGFCWSVQSFDAPFRSSGELAERWIP